jgi:hypothetical protein
MRLRRVYVVFLSCFLCSLAVAQRPRGVPVSGYITAVHPPNAFEVNGKQVLLKDDTQYGLIGHSHTGPSSGLRDQLQVGVYVDVKGSTDHHTRVTAARRVYLLNQTAKKLAATGVVDKLIAPGAYPIFRAAGYRVALTPATNLTFVGDTSSLAELSTNSWVQYEGRLDSTGTLVASKLKLFNPKATRFKAIPGLEVYHHAMVPANSPSQSPSNGQVQANAVSAVPPPNISTILDTDGNLTADAKIRIGTFESWHRVPADLPLQERIRRIGIRLVPEYQKALPADHPSAISFRFYAVDDPDVRGEICYLDGLVLIPRQLLDRLKTDDQIAALLADGIAYNLQRQAARMVQQSRLEAVAVAALVPFPLGAAIFLGAELSGDEPDPYQEERSRIALALMIDAGYDPYQAPEAWRLLAPKQLSADTRSLPYPNRSGYQLSILNSLYHLAPNARL